MLAQSKVTPHLRSFLTDFFHLNSDALLEIFWILQRFFEFIWGLLYSFLYMIVHFLLTKVQSLLLLWPFCSLFVLSFHRVLPKV